MYPHANGLLRILELIIRRDNNTDYVRLESFDRLNQLQSRQSIHSNVRKQYVYGFFLENCHGFFRGICACYVGNFLNAAFFQPPCGAIAYHLIVIDNQYIHRIVSFCCSLDAGSVIVTCVFCTSEATVMDTVSP